SLYVSIVADRLFELETLSGGGLWFDSLGLELLPLLGKQADALLHPTRHFGQHRVQVEFRQVHTQRFQHAHDDAATTGSFRRLVRAVGLAILGGATQNSLR